MRWGASWRRTRWTGVGARERDTGSVGSCGGGARTVGGEERKNSEMRNPRSQCLAIPVDSGEVAGVCIETKHYPSEG